MGKKLSPETVEKIARLKSDSNNSIFNHDNPYGYRLNVAHPWVRNQYEKYKDKIGASILSDAERLEFERVVIEFLEKKKGVQK